MSEPLPRTRVKRMLGGDCRWAIEPGATQPCTRTVRPWWAGVSSSTSRCSRTPGVPSSSPESLVGSAATGELGGGEGLPSDEAGESHATSSAGSTSHDLERRTAASIRREWRAIISPRG